MRELRARGERLAHLLHAGGTVRQCLHHRRHDEGGNAVGELTLQLDHLLREAAFIARHGDVAHAPAGHGEGLAHAVHGDGAAGQARIGAGAHVHHIGLHLGIDQLLVDLVADDGHMRVAGQHVAQFAHDGLRLHHAAGIARAVQDDGARARRDGALDGGHIQAEAPLHGAGHLHAATTVQLDERLVAHPRRRGQDHLVARAELQQRLHAHGDGVLGTRGERDVLGLACDAVLHLQLARHRLAHGLVAGRGCVARHARVQRALGGFANGCGRVEVGLAHAETDHGLARGLQRRGLRRHRQRGALLHACDRFTDVHGVEDSGDAPTHACPDPCHRYTAAMHFDAHQPVLDELEARITAIRDSL